MSDEDDEPIMISKAFADNVKRFLAQGFTVDEAISRAQVTPSSYFEVNE